MANHQLIINRFPVIINLAAIVRGMSGQRPNRKAIVNPFTVIVNSHLLESITFPSPFWRNLSPRLRLAAPRVRRVICIQFADNFTMIRPNLPILRVPDFFNLPIIYRFSRGIYRLPSAQRVAKLP